MSTVRALIIDDERDICDLLSMALTRMSIVVDSAQNVSQAKIKLAENQCNKTKSTILKKICELVF